MAVKKKQKSIGELKAEGRKLSENPAEVQKRLDEMGYVMLAEIVLAHFRAVQQRPESAALRMALLEALGHMDDQFKKQMPLSSEKLDLLAAKMLEAFPEGSAGEAVH